MKDEAANEKLIFQADRVRTEVSSVSLVYGPKVLTDLLDGQIANAKFSEAVGSTYAPKQRPEGGLFEGPVCVVSECDATLSAYEYSVDQAHAWWVRVDKKSKAFTTTRKGGQHGSMIRDVLLLTWELTK